MIIPCKIYFVFFIFVVCANHKKILQQVFYEAPMQVQPEVEWVGVIINVAAGC